MSIVLLLHCSWPFFFIIVVDNMKCELGHLFVDWQIPFTISFSYSFAPFECVEIAGLGVD